MPELIPPARNTGKCPREDNCLAVLLAKDEAATANASEKCWRKKYEDMQGLANELYLAARAALATHSQERLQRAVDAITQWAKAQKEQNHDEETR